MMADNNNGRLTIEQVAHAFGVPPWLIDGPRPPWWRRLYWRITKR
jgi:hypothetical protein